MKQSSPLFLIDLLKVFAALLIIFHHLSSYGQVAADARALLPSLMNFIFEYGRYAVQIFLVMAGYLAAQSLTRFADTTFSSQNLLRLIINRYLRLVAPYTAALIFTILCASIARFWVNDEFVGQSETFTQFLAHIFFLQGILGFDSISAGVWYVAIDWQLYCVLAILLLSFSSYQALIWLLSIVAVSALLYFNRSSQYEAYFIYFIGSYGLGVLAYLSKHFADGKINRIAKLALFIIGAVILLTSFHELWLRNILAWSIAFLLLLWGNAPYPQLGNTAGRKATNQERGGMLRMIAWGAQRSYCAFLIHFAFILLANTLYIALGLHSHESGILAIAFMFSAVLCSVLAANVLYQMVEQPLLKLKI